MKKIAFRQPEILGRDHQFIEIEDELYKRLVSEFLNDQDTEFPTNWDPDAEFSSKLSKQIQATQSEIMKRSGEFLKVYSVGRR